VNPSNPKERIMDVKVLGPGCANCRTTLALLEQVAREKGVAASFGKIEDLKEIMSHGLMSTPGVMIDGIVVHAGGVPSRAKVEQWFSALGGKKAAEGTGGCCGGSSKPKCCG
jgi:small redox-active disulfide protein 2